MRRSPGAESVRTVLKILLIHGFPPHRDRPLQDFVLEGRHPDRPLLRPVTPFRNVGPTNWRRLVAARLEAVQKTLEILFQVLLVRSRRLAVHPRGAIFARSA